MSLNLLPGFDLIFTMLCVNLISPKVWGPLKENPDEIFGLSFFIGQKMNTIFCVSRERERDNY